MDLDDPDQRFERKFMYFNHTATVGVSIEVCLSRISYSEWTQSYYLCGRIGSIWLFIEAADYTSLFFDRSYK